MIGHSNLAHLKNLRPTFLEALKHGSAQIVEADYAGKVTLLRQPNAGPGAARGVRTDPEQAGEMFTKARPKLAAYSHIAFFSAPSCLYSGFGGLQAGSWAQ